MEGESEDQLPCGLALVVIVQVTIGLADKNTPILMS